jgi:hypothetical protein
MPGMATSRLRHPVPMLALAATIALIVVAPPRPAHAAARPAGTLVPATGALFGAYVDPDGQWTGNADQEAEITAFESTIGRTLNVVQHFYSWTNTFPSGLEQWDLQGGRTPLISWGGTALDPIISGSYDDMIRTRADQVKALGAPVFLRWCWEMNGNWSSCDGTHNNSPGQTDGPGKFVQAWRHIHDLFTAEGATNVVWVWSPNDRDIPSDAWNHWANYYPGDGYVDWVGIDGYNWGTTQSWSSWTSFASLFTAVYSDYASRKPIMIAETASAEQGGSKAQWITDARTAMETQFPSIAAFLWFDVLKEADWRMNSSASSLAASKHMARAAYFDRKTATLPPGPGGRSHTRRTIEGLRVTPVPLVRWVRISFRLNRPTAVTVQIRKASNGKAVRTLRREVIMGTGLHSMQWRGHNGRGIRVRPGPFVIVVRAPRAGHHVMAARHIRVLRAPR